MRFKIAVILLSLLLSLTGCGDKIGELIGDSDYSLEGQVIKKSTGEGLSGVKLLIKGSALESEKRVTTNSSGSWQMSGVEGEVSIIPQSTDWSFKPNKVTVSQSREEIIIKAAPITLSSKSDFKVGVAVQTNYLEGVHGDKEAYIKRVTEEFDSITPEYELKQKPLMTGSKSYDWSASDQLVDFAQEHDLRIFGHTLCWEWNLTDRMRGLPQEEFKSEVKYWIRKVMNRYKGDIKAYDVVNEGWKWNRQRENTYYEKMGSDYIKWAFEYAHQIDPEALLFYNDFHLVTGNGKFELVLDMIDRFQEQGVPIDGVGFQMHLEAEDIGPELYSKIENCFKAVADRGLKVHVSEFDLVLNEGEYDSYNPELEQRRKEIVKKIVSIYNKLPEENKFGFTVWGLRDNSSWQNNIKNYPTWPLLFSKNYEKKPAYYGFLAGLD